MCFRQRQTKPNKTEAIWTNSIIIMKGKKGPHRIMTLLQEQGNNEQSLVCCLPRQFPTRKQIHEETKAQILEIQNILFKITASGRFWDTRSCTFLGTPDSHVPQPSQLLTVLSVRHSPLLLLQSLQVWELPMQLLKSQLLNLHQAVDILYLSDEKSVSSLLLRTTSQFILSSWTEPESLV